MPSKIFNTRFGASLTLYARATALIAVSALVSASVACRAAAQPIPPSKHSASPKQGSIPSGKFTYDTDKCSRDPEGMVYFAVGRRVLRQPLENLVYMLGKIEVDEPGKPHVRFPNEPIGCPDHPIQMEVFHLANVAGLPSEAPSPVDKEVSSIKIIVHDGRPFRQNDAVIEGCIGKTTDPTIDGFIGCRVGLCEQNRSYVALSYADFNQVKIALDCSIYTMVGQCRPDLEKCMGGYRLERDFTVNLYFSTVNLPIERFIEADRELRRRLRAAEVAFEWASVGSGLKTEK